MNNNAYNEPHPTNKGTKQMTKIEEIYAMLLPELEANDIEDTTEHRLWALEGLRDAWLEDSETIFEKTLYMLAINGEIFVLKLKLRYQEILT